MRTRRSNYPNNSNVTIPRRRRRQVNIVEPEIRTIVAPMAERIMEELLRAPMEGYGEAIELLRACPHHGFTKLTQVDTFYNGLNDNEQDSLNAAAGVNLLSKTTRDALNIIENKSKVRYLQNKPNDSRMNATSSKMDERIDKLADQLSTLVEIVSKKVVTPAPVKVVEESYVTCGGAHSWYNCPATDNNQASVCATTGTYNQVNPQNRVSNQMAPPGFAPVQNNGQNRFNQNHVQGNNFNRGNNFHGNQGFQNQNNHAPNFQNQGFQNQPFQVPNNQVQQEISNDFSSYKRNNDQMLRNMQSQINSLKGDLKNEIQNSIKSQQAVMMNQQTTFQNNLQNMICGLFQNQASTSGILPSNTIPNPKVERETKETTDEEQTNFQGSTAQIPPPVIPIFILEPDVPTTLLKTTDLRFDISFADALLLMPRFAPTIKSLLMNKEKLLELAKIPLNENCSAMLLKKLPEKLGDPGKFLIPCNFLGMDVCHALADLGASINLMPLSIWKKLSLPDLTPTRMTLELADRSITYPKGLAEDVFVNQSWEFQFPTDFCYCRLRKITLRVDNKAVTFNLDQTTRYSSTNDKSVNRIDIIDAVCEEYAPELLGFSNSSGDNPTPTSEPFTSEFILEEIEAYLKDDSISPEIDHADCDPEEDICLIEKLLNNDPFQLPPMDLKQSEVTEAKSSIEEPPELELKDLPSHLEYAFLEENDKLPVIIAKGLKNNEKDALLKVLKSHKRAIAWKITDIKGIDPRFCTHKILMEDDYKPTVQSQRRVNPKIHEVIKKEVLKLLDAGMIYPISDSPWVSPVHCVPKKGGITVVANEENELIPTRLVTGWRVCIDYRKLNEATRKDHFPLPFMDQMLERLAGNEFYCFLDGFSGYFQIPIDPQDQEKTTFTCPYGTFAYRRMPFGLCNAPGTFQRCMMAIFHDMIEKTMEVFMDDFSVFGDSFDSCLSNLEKMLKRCEDTNLVLNGGSALYGREGIVIARPMTHLLEKETLFVFSKDCIDAFQTLKKKLTEAPILDGNEQITFHVNGTSKHPQKHVNESIKMVNDTCKDSFKRFTNEPALVCLPPSEDVNNEKEKQEVKNLAEPTAKRQTCITPCLKNFKVICKESIFHSNKAPQVSSVFATTSTLPSIEPKDSLIMGDEHLSTFSNEEIIPIPRESEETSRSDSKNVLPLYDDFSSINVPRDDSVTFSNPLFEFDVNFNSSDINPLFDDVLEDIECKDSYDSNLDKSTFLGFIDDPLFEENDDLFDLECKTNDWKGILYDAPIDKIDVFLAIKVPTYIDGYFDSKGDSDPLHHEFTGELITIPPRIDGEHEDYINRMSLLCGNSSSRSLENFHTIIESLPTSTTLIEDSDSNREEIDIFSRPDDSIPPGIESEDTIFDPGIST
ncbi:reverse transcriptase domain-containing protein [Tanacetum coccineum]